MVHTIRHPVSESLAGLTTPETEKMISSLTVAMYGAVAILGGLTTLLTAWYYYSRSKPISRFLSQTPEWIIQTLRAAA